MSPTIALILDLVMVGLLAATIAYAIILNKQIIRLRESRGEMTELIRGLNEAMTKAEGGVRGLKKAAAETGEDLQRTVNKAQSLRDELEFMIEAADALANRLGSVGDDRSKPAPRPAIRPAGLSSPMSSHMPASRPAAPPIPVPRPVPPIDDQDEPPPALLRRPPPLAEPRDPVTREGENLSRAERELLQALENAGKGVE